MQNVNATNPFSNFRLRNNRIIKIVTRIQMFLSVPHKLLFYPIVLYKCYIVVYPIQHFLLLERCKF